MQGAKLSEEIHTKKDPHTAQLEGHFQVRKYSTNQLNILQTAKRVMITPKFRQI